jgi:DNA-binding HxlR family transcriptional regulator
LKAVGTNRLAFSSENCSVAGALAIVGEKWTLLVMREAFYGLRRFDELHQAIGCAKNVLADRLRTLVGHGLLERIPYREGDQRERFEYKLTAKGVDLFPAVIALMQWGDRWLAESGKHPVLVEHIDCGGLVRVELRCAHRHGPLSARDTRAKPGPGARRARATERRSSREGSERDLAGQRANRPSAKSGPDAV